MLMVAAMHGRSRCVSALLGELGAEPDVATVGKQETALHLKRVIEAAVLRAHPEWAHSSVSLTLSAYGAEK